MLVYMVMRVEAGWCSCWVQGIIASCLQFSKGFGVSKWWVHFRVLGSVFYFSIFILVKITVWLCFWVIIFVYLGWMTWIFIEEQNLRCYWRVIASYLLGQSLQFGIGLLSCYIRGGSFSCMFRVTRYLCHCINWPMVLSQQVIKLWDVGLVSRLLSSTQTFWWSLTITRKWFNT